MALNVEGITLKSFNYGDKHKIAKVITPNLGVIGVFVANANKVSTKHSALVQPLTCARFNLKESTNANSDLLYLYNGEVENFFLTIKTDYEKLAYFYHMAEIILKGIFEKESCQYIYKILKQSLCLVEAGHSSYLLNLIFQLKMLPMLGIKPELDCCCVCRTRENIVMLSVSQGGLVCFRCAQGNEPALIDAPLVPIVRALFKVDLENFPEIELEDELLKPIEIFLDSYYDSYSGLHLKSKKFITDLNLIEK